MVPPVLATSTLKYSTHPDIMLGTMTTIAACVREFHFSMNMTDARGLIYTKIVGQGRVQDRLKFLTAISVLHGPRALLSETFRGGMVYILSFMKV
jgi:hypothetical protein